MEIMCKDKYKKYYVYYQEENNDRRKIDTNNITVAFGYSIEPFLQKLDEPTSILFTDGEVFIASSGYTNRRPYVARYINGELQVLSEDFKVPITGINFKNGDLYISHKGTITTINKMGIRKDIIKGLPSMGDYSNSRVAFGNDNKMYFGLGTATNSGVVGIDNFWVSDEPQFHDNPGAYIFLKGQNFPTKNILIDGEEIINTGAFSAFGESNLQFESRKAIVPASGSVVKSNLDGSNLELIAWGLRSPSFLRFDSNDRLFVSNNGYDIRGSRPIANALDELYIIKPGEWYGWPDYSAGEPLTLEKFKPANSKQPEFLLTCHPSIPPKPFTTFPSDSTIIGFDFNPYSSFGNIGDIYIAEFGNITPFNYDVSSLQYTTGHKISKVDIKTGGVSTFIMNKSGLSLSNEGGISRPADVAFGPDGNMYIVDMGISSLDNPNKIIPHTGVIWKVKKI